MTNMTIFPALRITKNPKYFSDSNRVEIKAADVDDKNTFPNEFKLVYRGWDALKIAKTFTRGVIVTVHATAEAYQGRIFGVRGKELKNTNGSGKTRYTTKHRFNITSIVCTSIYHR